MTFTEKAEILMKGCGKHFKYENSPMYCGEEFSIGLIYCDTCEGKQSQAREYLKDFNDLHEDRYLIKSSTREDISKALKVLDGVKT